MDYRVGYQEPYPLGGSDPNPEQDSGSRWTPQGLVFDGVSLLPLPKLPVNFRELEALAAHADLTSQLLLEATRNCTLKAYLLGYRDYRRKVFEPLFSELDPEVSCHKCSWVGLHSQLRCIQPPLLDSVHESGELACPACGDYTQLEYEE